MGLLGHPWSLGLFEQSENPTFIRELNAAWVKSRSGGFKTCSPWDFPGGPVVKTSPSNAGGAGSNPSRGAKIPHALWPKTKT